MRPGRSAGCALFVALVPQMVLVLASIGGSGVAGAHTLYRNESGTQLDLLLDLGLGLFASQSDYSGRRRGSVEWSLAGVRTGLGARLPLGPRSRMYATISGIGIAVNGDGDAAGVYQGGYSDFSLNEAYIGWQYDEPFGVDSAIDFSIGKQGLTIGNGWLVNGGSLVAGTGLVFDRTVVARLRSGSGFAAKAFYLDSGDALQGKTDLAGADLSYANDAIATLGATFLRVTGVDSSALGGLRAARDGLNTYSARGLSGSSLGNTTLSFEATLQRGRPNIFGQSRKVKAWAWYAQADYRFADRPWRPRLVYRFSSFSGDDPATRTLEGYDPLFYGFYRHYGTWIQGDVAGAYTGPFNRNADIQHIGFYLHPPDLYRAGVMFFDFRNRQPTHDASHNFAREWDFFFDWRPRTNMLVSPSFVVFDPGPGAAARLGTHKTNYFLQMIVLWRL